MLLERLEYFVALADELHFGRAAHRLHLSQPALSQQIKRLERDLGTTLCERGPRGVVLTPAGRALAAGARTLLRDHARLVDEVRDLGAGGGGTLRVLYTRSGAELDSHDIVARYRAEHPAVTVRTDVGWTSRNLAQVRSGEADAAFVRPPVDEPTLDVRVVGRSELVAVLPRGHRSAARRRVRPEELVDDTFVFWPRDQGPDFHDAVLADVWGGAAPGVRIDEPDAEHIVAAVASGAGFSVLDRTRARRLTGGRSAVVRRFVDPVPTADIALVWRRDRERTSAPLALLVAQARSLG